jgi:hypothetical protein
MASGYRYDLRPGGIALGGVGGADSVTSLSRDAGSAAGGARVNVFGTGITEIPPAVNFGGTLATGVTVSSTTMLTCSVPAQSVGTVDVGISGHTLSNAFVYLPAPTTT